jgi:pyrroline-5-carboxylate reductase
VRIGIIGNGRLGSALAKGWRNQKDLTVFLAFRRPPRVPGPDTLVAELPPVDLVVLAVKPKDVASALLQHRAAIADAPVVSVAAGVSLDTLARLLGRRGGVARAMPNICATVGAAVTVFCQLTPDAGLERTLYEVFGRLGQVIGVPRAMEDRMDAVTALSGSGPAYIFEVVDGLAAAGEALGLDPAQARWLAAETARGAALMMLAHADMSLESLVGQVASPGGTTEEALRVMRDRGLRTLLQDAVTRAAQRSRVLGG